jgi:hypothetical protein
VVEFEVGSRLSGTDYRVRSRTQNVLGHVPSHCTYVYKVAGISGNVAGYDQDVNPAQHLDGDLIGGLTFKMYTKMYALGERPRARL